MKEEIKKELTDFSPLLAKLKARQSEENPALPSNYFHNMQVEVMGKIQEEMNSADQAEKQKSPVNWWKLIFKPQVSIAFASALILIVAGLFFIKNSDTEPPLFADLTEGEILEYIEENIEDFDAISLTEISEEEIYLENIPTEEIDRHFQENIDQIDDDDFENLF